jgi:DNA-binding GntR family transcriptional regulator
LEKTLVDRIYESLLEHILFGRILPGTILNEVELSKLYGTSRIVIREVLVRLATAGIVVKNPYQKARVREFAEKDIEDLFDVRLYLELLAIEKIDKLPYDKYEFLKTLIVGPDVEISKYISMDRTLHEEIIKLANNNVLMNFYLQIRDQVQVARAFMTTRRPERILEANKEHYIFLDALLNGDKDTAIRITRQHVESAKAETIMWIRRSKESH